MELSETRELYSNPRLLWTGADGGVEFGVKVLLEVYGIEYTQEDIENHITPELLERQTQRTGEWALRELTYVLAKRFPDDARSALSSQ